MLFKKLILNILAFFLAFLFLLPIAWMIIASLKPEGISAIAISDWIDFSNLTLKNYIKVIESSKILLWTYNSFLIATLSTIILIFICSLAAFAFSKLDFKLKVPMYLLLVTGLLIPTEAILIPLYETVLKFGLIDSKWGVILPGLTNSLGVFLLKQFMDGIRNEYIEAAVIDGCNKFLLWWRICLPLTKSSMLAVGIFYFLLSWNNFIWPFICITSEENMVLPTGIPTFMSSNLLVLNTIMAASALAAIPAMIVFIVLQKFIIQGVSMSGVKA